MAVSLPELFCKSVENGLQTCLAGLVSFSVDVIILLNPAAGKGRALAKRAELETALQEAGLSYELYVTESETHLKQLLVEYGAKVPVIAGVGGDSTFTIMVNEVLKHNLGTTLALFALGSQDDIGRDYGLLDMKETARAIKARRSARIDLGAIKEGTEEIATFLGQVNLGLGASVNRYVAQKVARYSLFRNWLTLWGTMGVLSALRKQEIPLEIELFFRDQRPKLKANLALFSKIRNWAGGKKFLPSALHDDGLLHCLTIAQCGFGRLFKISNLATHGNHLEEPEVKTYQAQSFRVKSSQAFLLQADGEIIRHPDGQERYFNEVEIFCKPAAVSVIKQI